MPLTDIGPGDKAPDEINIIIEIPALSNPVKYEVDKKTGAMFVDRFLSTAMHYPCNYGYVPHTLCDDGDPCDVLVLTPFPLLTGAVIRSRPVGVLKMTDEAGEDAKILAVPITKLSQDYRDINDYNEISPRLIQTIEHFFAHYKDLEPDKWVKIQGWGGAQEAKEVIRHSIELCVV